jgi:hypothetical protein
MILIFREFRVRAADGERMLSVLRKRAAAMICDGGAEAVLVCQRIDLPQHLLWIQQQVKPRVPAVGGETSPPSTESSLVESDGAPVRAEFVDGAYQFPLPPCRLWVAETPDERVARTLLTISRRAVSDRRVSGVSVYRTLEDPSRLIAFFALAPDVAPDDYFKSAGEPEKPKVAFYPLRVSWTIGRLMPGTPSVASLVRYPRAAFWARLGLVSPSEATAVTLEEIMEPSASQRS